MMYILMLTRRYPAGGPSAVGRRSANTSRSGSNWRGYSWALSALAPAASSWLAGPGRFGMKIAAIDIREVSESERQEFGLSFVGTPDDLEKVVSESDVLSLHLHLNS